MRHVTLAFVLASLGCGRISFEPQRSGDGGPHDGIHDADDDAGEVPPDAVRFPGTSYLKPAVVGSGDRFGWQIALSADGNTLAVGAHAEASIATGIDGDATNNAATLAGAAYVFVRGRSGWIQQAYVKASNTAAGDAFGYAVALSADGNTLAVGAPGEDSGATGINGDQADNSASGAGAVYVFSRTGVTWSQQAYIKASNAEANDIFGAAVALSADGSTLAVGADSEDSAGTGPGSDQASNGALESGAAYVFSRAGAVWSQQAYLKASNTDASDRFGFKVALAGNGNTLAVTATGEASGASGVGGNQADNSQIQAGAVYVFIRAGTVWTQDAYVKPSNPDGGDFFGSAVALSGDGTTLAVSAEGEDGPSVGVNGPQLEGAGQAGAVYVFERGVLWSQVAYVKATNTETEDRFGHSVALSATGSMLAVGATQEDSKATDRGGIQADNTANNSGAAYLYMRSGGFWSATDYVKASNTDADDQFGKSVSLSAEGDTLAVSAFAEDSASTDPLNNAAPDAGAVYVYE